MEEEKNSNVLNPTPISSVKRSFDDTIVNFQHPNYSKMMALLKDMRPHFLEVLETPGFKNCEAAQEFTEKIEAFTTLYEEMTAESTSPLTKCQNVSGQFQDGRKSREHSSRKKSSETKTPFRLFEDDCTCIVGMSPIGFNYITFVSSEARYHGRTKEEFRASKKTRLRLFEDDCTCIVGMSPIGVNYITFVSSEASYYGRTKEEFRASKVVKSSEESLFGDKGQKNSYIGGSPLS